jgi:NAD(P)-dependent dehydrogenase (short-subunit alcohol dehydrogenase family)
MAKTPFNSKSTAEEVLEGVDLAGRTILITGCSGGIGLETMRTLALHGAHVIGLARSLDGAQRACSQVDGTTTPVACDLSDLRSVETAAKFILDRFRTVDVVIANASITGTKERAQRYGIEMQFLVNYLSHFLLVNRLLPIISDATGRVVIVSSSASKNQAPKEGILFDDLDGQCGYTASKFYGQSKLALAIFAKELSRRLKPRGISANLLHPGAVRGTDLNRNVGFPLSAVLAVAQLFFKTPAQGAAMQCLLAASPLVKGATGGYWANCQIAEGSAYLADQNMAKRLWTISEELMTRNLSVAA